MDLHSIENLLDKYFDGNTSLIEENTLRNYFAQDNVPEHLQEYKNMFAYFSTKKEEVSQQEIQVNTKKTWQFNRLAIAASFLLLISAFWFLKPKSLTNAEKQEATYAYNETVKAFQLISQNLKRGNNAIAYLDEFENTKSKIFKK